MPLLLSNEDVTGLLTMPDCLAAVERSFLELGRHEAVSRPRSELHLPHKEHGRHYLVKTWDAALPEVGLAAVRITSNMMQESHNGGVRRLDPLPLAPGGNFVGLILLFDIATLALVGVVQDSRLQVMRAGATYGLAAKYLARTDASVLGLLGSGGQAREQLTAIALVRSLSRVKVFSPTRDHRERFAREMSERLELDVLAYDDPRQVVQGSDIVAAATSALEPVIHGEWLEPGQHVSFAGPGKGDEAATARASIVALQTDEQTLRWRPAKHASRPGHSARTEGRDALDPARVVLLPDVVARRHPGRTHPDQITLFGGFNTFGPGTAYAAVGAVVLQRASEQGVGRELPADWFTQRESS
jgi:alanine dehydrogenase